MPLVSSMSPVRDRTQSVSRIHILPPEVANVIAAGEVIERPASVVRELVDNALDAGASHIIVRLEDAGKRLIEVQDDGEGMTEAEALLCLQRHATSKIRHIDDLQALQTLGFRGEALPSIAAAARLVITTCPRDEAGGGVRLLSEARGTQISVQRIACPPGTSIRVESLFAELPARQKFLKGERTELSHIQDFLRRIALAYPQCRFELQHQGRTLLACHTTQGLEQRITELFGAECRDQLIPLTSTGAIDISGYLGAPALARSGAAQLYTFINGRAIRDRVLMHAIQEGYRTYIPSGETPFVILLLRMSAEEVDVNVHPAKAEVRFRAPGAVHNLVYHAIRKTLSTRATGIGQSPAAPRSHTIPALTTATSTPGPEIGGRAAGSAARSPAWTLRETPVPNYASPTERPPAVQYTFAPVVATSAEGTLRPLGQLNQTYLLFEGPDGSLIVIDQHAAHERIGYEHFKREWAAGGIESQALLTPELITLDPAAIEAVLEHETVWQRLGLLLEPFGDGSIAIKAVPALLKDAALTPLIQALAHDCLDTHGAASLESRIDYILMTMACHRMVRAGAILGASEASALVETMGAGENTDRCPHGRPTWVRIPKSDIERWFRRR